MNQLIASNPKPVITSPLPCFSQQHSNSAVKTLVPTNENKKKDRIQCFTLQKNVDTAPHPLPGKQQEKAFGLLLIEDIPDRF